MVSLNDLRSAAVDLDWHEAVAAGAALATLLADAQAPACPHPADVAVLPSGDLRVTGPGHVDGSTAAGVAHVVALLLEPAPYPAELRQVIDGYAGERSSGGAAIGELVAALAFFERPGRREVLAAVAERAELALERARQVSALEALTERTRLAAGGVPAQCAAVPVVRRGADVDASANPVPSGWEGADPSGPSRLILLVAVGLLAFLTVVFGAAAWLDRPSPARAASVEDDLPISGPVAADDGAPPPGTATALPGHNPPAARDRAAGGWRTPGPAAGPPPSGDAVSRPRGATEPARPSPAPRAVDVVVDERDGRVVPSSVAPVRPTPPRAAAGGPVFQSGDARVTPAVLIRPLLPDHPPSDVPEEQVGTLEFVVMETGAVEHVHLVSPANRYQERMLVAAAKTWQFQPATRDGRPVRYRARIRITL